MHSTESPTDKLRFNQGRIQGVSCVSMDTVNIISKKRKINVYFYYPVRIGQVMVGNYFNDFDW